MSPLASERAHAPPVIPDNPSSSRFSGIGANDVRFFEEAAVEVTFVDEAVGNVEESIDESVGGDVEVELVS